MWFLAIASAACISHFLRKDRASFNLGFWVRWLRWAQVHPAEIVFQAFTFPLGSMNLLTYGLADTFDNWTFRILGTIMSRSTVMSLWMSCLTFPGQQLLQYALSGLSLLYQLQEDSSEGVSFCLSSWNHIRLGFSCSTVPSTLSGHNRSEEAEPGDRRRSWTSCHGQLYCLII